MGTADDDAEKYFMVPHSHDSETIALLRQIARLLEYWKFTALYISAVLTLWLYLAVSGRIM